MKRTLLLGLGLLSGALMVGGDALACGDKLMVFARGLRAKRKPVSKASILVYARPGGSLPAALGQGGLQKNLERAGHRVNQVGTEDELKKALAEGGYDLVLADVKAAPRIEAEANSAPTHPTVVPTLYNPSRAELTAAESTFQCVLKSPAKEKDYLAVVDQAMAARARQGRAGKK
jgi:hypothetical protein